MATARTFAAVWACLALIAWPATTTWAQPEHDAAPAAADQHAEGAQPEGDAHDAGHAAGHAVNTSPLEFKRDLAIWTVVVFVMVLLVLYWFAWGRIIEGLDRREQGIADNIAAAQKTNDDARALLADYERKLAAAQDEVRAVLDEARRDAERSGQDIVARANAEARAAQDRAMREIETAKNAAVKAVAEEAANMAVDLAGRVVGRELSASDHARLIEDSMSKFSRRAPSNN